MTQEWRVDPLTEVVWPALVDTARCYASHTDEPFPPGGNHVIALASEGKP